MTETLLEMTKSLVMAQIEAQHVTPDNLHGVLHSTYNALHQLHAMEERQATRVMQSEELNDSAATTGAAVSSAVDWKSSITKHAIICLECGDSFKQLSRRHLQRHGMDSKAYRAKYGIPSDQPLSARVATARRRQLAKSIRPWEQAKEARLAAKQSRRKRRS